MALNKYIFIQLTLFVKQQQTTITFPVYVTWVIKLLLKPNVANAKLSV